MTEPYISLIKVNEKKYQKIKLKQFYRALTLRLIKEAKEGVRGIGIIFVAHALHTYDNGIKNLTL